MRKILSFITVLVFLSPFLQAQKTAIYRQPEANYRDAVELFEKEKYGAARQKFNEVITQIDDEKSVISADAMFYAAICAVELYNNDAEYELYSFIEEYPENSKLNIAWFRLGSYQYAISKYKDAVESFEMVDINDLTPNQLNEYYFKKGYSCFINKDYEAAKKAFIEVKKEKSQYSAPATYYYAHILYTEKNYQTALQHFEKLTTDENFGSVVPYYITQLYYLQDKYDELLKVAPELLKSSTPKRAPEISRLIGESYYRTNRFKEAIPYLRLYQEKTTLHIERSDNYQLAFAYYKAGFCDTAIVEFNKMITEDDTLTQNAQYHLADCYIRTSQKKFARNAFAAVYKLGFDKQMSEDALFQFAKLSYELSINPYNDAIESFNKYIADYPKSSRIDEANGYLVNIYISTKNYKDALKSIEKINKKDARLLEAYQRISFNRAVELFNEGKLKESQLLFNKAIENDYNDVLVALSYNWIGEAFYKLKDDENALKSYKKFQVSSGAYSLPEYNTSNYNIAYIYFQQKNYTDALAYFKKFNLNAKAESVSIKDDALLRTGDCYFISKDYANAIENYDKAIALKQTDGDYALYQKSLSLGAQGKFENKINTLVLLVTNYKKSTYLAASIYELARTYLITENNEKALQNFQLIVDNYPNSSYAKDALLKIGLIHYNMHHNELAIKTLDNVIKKYPATASAKEALITMRNIYVEMDKVDEFLERVKSYPTANISIEEQDSITYIAVENRYMEGDCQKATSGFANYMQKFPSGAFIAPAKFYKAECDYKSGNITDALGGYEYLLNIPTSKFTEKALLNAAEIAYKLKKYDKSLAYYQRLDTTAEFNNNILTARIGVMRSSFLINKYDIAIVSSNKLLNTPKISNEYVDEAHSCIAKSAFANDSIALAQSEFALLTKSKNGEINAEARYHLALIQFKQGNLIKSESIIYEYISAAPSSEFWLAKTLILWSDIYVQQKNYPQAKATLQSIIDKYEGADLVKVAKDKFDAIILLEKQAEDAKKKEEENKAKENEIKINLNKNTDGGGAKINKESF
ncbi:MAG: tetratricopeptide repeat protein [Bacteroidetes bacterium]|nr:tetratricopeptide repeat protein [Bacteroidota bacterium]